MVYVKIKDNTAQAKALLAMLKTLPFVEIIEKDNVPNQTTLKAMKEVEAGKVIRAKSAKELIKKLRK
jgi:hypothetical protein